MREITAKATNPGKRDSVQHSSTAKATNPGKRDSVQHSSTMGINIPLWGAGGFTKYFSC